MINDSVWFYTLSTIAQACAAILALGGAFVVFKLDKTQTAISNYKWRVIDILRALEIKQEKTEAPYVFFKKKNQEILDLYMKYFENKCPVYNKNLQYFFIQKEGFNSVQYNPDRTITVGYSGLDQFKHKVLNEELYNWCQQMSNLFEENFMQEKRIYSLLKISLFLLTISIIFSIFLLNIYPDWLIDKYILFIVSGWALGSIIFSGVAVWKIAKLQPLH